ncbi:MAG: hypothetical protein Q8R47_03340 [Nanoarchaeota archaeon]|nr:hypothetical protein [Nanoarchaeota archaeon]
MINKNYIVNGATTATSLALGTYNEILQKRVQNHELEWHPILGQGSDIAAGAMFTALFLMFNHYKEQKYNHKLIDWTAPLAAGTLCTIGEITSIMGDIFDPKDIAAYWLGAGIAYVVHRAFATNTLEGKITPKSL